MRLAACWILLCATATAHAQTPPPAPDPDAPAGAGSAAPPDLAAQPEIPPTHADPAPLVPITPSSPPVAAAAVVPDTAPGDDWSFRPGGFIQPEYRMRQNAPGAPEDTDGYRLVRARITAVGTGHVGSLEIGSYFEAELQPSFSLYDAYVTASETLPHKLVIAVDAGQMRVPISRQQLISDTRRSFVESAEITSIAPDRDLGVRVTASIPHVRAIFGSFNGEGRDQGENINEKFMTAGRLEITPFGEQAPYAEGAFNGDFLSFGASVGYDKLTPGAYSENELFLGYDISAAWKGLSGEFEYLQVHHSFVDSTNGTPLEADYRANGFVAQVAYLLPIAIVPSHLGRLEFGARVEEIDRNDVTPIIQIGDPNQSERIYTANVSYYLREHRMKLQLAAEHWQEIENRTATGQNATYPNDQLLLQLTYRME